ncbi:hypothetical protein I4F81_001827 [Pyropia yezoensis]|uniref:Uncharacterized protein n=1 Tax=Pyropia yezoensis TaxID=2788 RepID=A0ACC3BMP2_PYRYE|nr:hypothetical protein I4F81_001827 [Neopyropia yezoensis]
MAPTTLSLPMAAGFVPAAPMAAPTARRARAATTTGRPPLLYRGAFAVPAAVGGGRPVRGLPASPTRRDPTMRYRSPDEGDVGVYRDPKTGALLSSWTNPFTGEVNEVVPVFNDPVNQEFLERHPQRGPFTVPTTVGGGDVYWSAEVFLNYPSPLPRADYPDTAQSDVYSSLEMFQFFGKEAQLADPTAPAASDVAISWVRLGQWLPFMRMGDSPGRIVYHTRGRRLAGGYGDLAADLRALVEAHDTKYTTAPTAFSTPNETSWTYFRKWLAQKGGARVDGTVAGPEPGEVDLAGWVAFMTKTYPVVGTLV